MSTIGHRGTRLGASTTSARDASRGGCARAQSSAHRVQSFPCRVCVRVTKPRLPGIYTAVSSAPPVIPPRPRVLAGVAVPVAPASCPAPALSAIPRTPRPPGRLPAQAQALVVSLQWKDGAGRSGEPLGARERLQALRPTGAAGAGEAAQRVQTILPACRQGRLCGSPERTWDHPQIRAGLISVELSQLQC